MGGEAKPPAKALGEGKPVGYQWQTFGPMAKRTGKTKCKNERW